MQSITVTADDWKRQSERFRAAAEAFSQIRREELESVGARLKTGLDARIGGSGKVQGWQEQAMGSLGGWVSVRPRAKTVTGKHVTYPVGYVTNAITGGHRIRRPSGRAERYRPRIRTAYVAGLGFYEALEPQSEALLRQAADRVAARLDQLLEEGG